MISKEKLVQLEKCFKEEVDSTTNIETVIKKFDSYYKYLQDRLIEPQDQEVFNLLHAHKLKLIYSLILWLDRRNLKAIDYTKDWNKKLVARVVEYCKEYEEHRKNDNLKENSFRIKEHYVLEDLSKSRDSLTASYCWNLLQRTLGPDFIPELISTFENGGEFQEKKETMGWVSRPGFGGKEIKDDGRKYWHSGVNELMTYDECTEKGLGHHLLMYTKGDSQQGYVGFMETDTSNVQKNFNKQTENFIETVFVSEETLI